MRWRAKSFKGPWEWRRLYALFPLRIEYPDGAEWVWLETVEVRTRVNEGGGQYLEGRRDGTA